MTYVSSGSFPLGAGFLTIAVPTDAQELYIHIDGVGGSSQMVFTMQYSIGGVLVSGAYYYSAIQNSTSTVSGASGSAAGSIPLDVAGANSASLFSDIKITGVQSGNTKAFYVSSAYGNAGAQAIAQITANNSSNTGLISSITVNTASGNFGAGTYRLYKSK